MDAEGDVSPIERTIRVTALDIVVPYPPRAYFSDDGSETPLAITSVIASVRTHERHSAESVCDLPVSFIDNVVVFEPLTVPDKPGTWFYSLKISYDAKSLTVQQGRFFIGAQVSVAP